MIIRPEKKEDLPYIHEVNREAFKQEDESELIARIRKSENFISDLSLVAVEKEKIIGHILFSKIKIIGQKDYDSLLLAPMAVIPTHQNQGVGGKLILEGLHKARELGFESVFVIGHKDYYPRFGFEKSSKWNIKCPFEVPEDAYMAIELRAGSLAGKSGVLKFPKEFSE